MINAYWLHRPIQNIAACTHYSNKGSGKESAGLSCFSRLCNGEAEHLEEACSNADTALRCLQLRASSAVAGNETLEALRHRQRLEARAAEEEDLMVRVPLSKEQKKQLKADRRVNLSGAAMMNDFADDVADLVGVSSFLVCHLLPWLQV